ncbi:hypothetical protein LCGC14_2403970 [marine sediment metagenome]|uniref:Uncharacterized protein n=1 Tax=marine sediment metagenome TaxID=412755 RepID=A0A0F9BUP0_9ZZZZ
MYLEIHRSLTRESKRLEQEAKKMNVKWSKRKISRNRRVTNISHVLCVWFDIIPTRMDFWNMSGIYKTVHRINVTIQDGVII